MKARFVIPTMALAAGLGFAASATLGASEPPGKAGPAERFGREVVASAQAGTTTTDTKFVEIEPARAFDSRIPAYIASGAFAPNTSRVVAIRDGHNSAGAVIAPDTVPVGATAVAYNLTVTGPTGPNFLAITPGDATGFTTSAINFNGTTDVANAGIVSIDANRTVKIWNGDQSGTTHAIIDITGYFVKPLFAEVSAGGTLVSGSRVVSAGSFLNGRYDVSFDRDVSACAITATIGPLEPAGVIDFGPAGPANTVRVYTSNTKSPPTFEARGFHLVVTC